ncbi:MAG: dihydroorotase [Actinobacteria bacterium]|nr:dihydroorotase [Actinomycetota bacterium]
MTNNTKTLKSVSLYGEEEVDLVIESDLITQILPSGTSDKGEVINASGLIALPGLVDLHCHLREPGSEDAETVLTASRAAALGGFTCVFAMPNTKPVADNAGVVEQVKHLGDEAGLVQVQPIGAVSINQSGNELAELGAMAQSAAQVRIFSDDGHCISDPLLMRRALEYVKAFNGVIAQHAQDPGLTKNSQMNEGSVSATLGLRGWPAIAEESIIARDCLIAEFVDSRYHVLHVTTARGAQIIKEAKERGVKVTAEVTPHHLLLTEDLIEGYNPVYKVNPPLRTKRDVLALQEALASGVIDCVATDHAPHSEENKDCEWDQAAFGMLGLETAISVLIQTMIKTKKISWRILAERMSFSPAKIAGLNDQGQPIEVGSYANLVLVDPNAEWTVKPENLASKSQNTPYQGLTLPGRVVHTIYRGKFTVKNSQIQA